VRLLLMMAPMTIAVKTNVMRWQQNLWCFGVRLPDRLAL